MILCGGRPIRYYPDNGSRGYSARKSCCLNVYDTNAPMDHCSPTGDTSVTRTCAGLICTWQEHKDVTTEAQPTLSTESANSGKILWHISIKVNCSTTGVPLVTQGYQYEQDTESIPDASTVRLTGQLGTQIPNAKNPSAPFGKAGWWGFILILLFLLGVAGVIRSCKNRSVLDCAKQYLLSGINCQWRCPSRGTPIID